ncbi:hypothetical protein R1sor_019945 [Riccia sorocarpa]|uniref:B30.2/SPRY domain-containing protein n=1 Tax=Riccia sorocarpa TaxID=122646 RepID=A0ABD3IDY7_9MARC
MSADVVRWADMSRVESPFHAIAAQALDDPSPGETVATPPAPAAAPVTSSDDRLEGDSLKTPDSPTQEENGVHEVEGSKTEREEEEIFGTGDPGQAKASSVATPDGGNEKTGEVVTKKSKKRTNVWTKTSSRKSAKKNGSKSAARPSDSKDDNVILKPFHQEDHPSYPVLLSKVQKAEKIELSLDRLTASGQKGYRMVRATRGVVQGAWYFEIFIENLGPTGHTRLGWSTGRGDIQAPVGYDAHSYAYRDLDGSKVHSAMREPYGEPYIAGDTIGFYINLPRDADYIAPDINVVGWKGQNYCIVTEEPLKPVPGSEILCFRNGVCQGVAFRDINDGTYYPAASLYTLPNQNFARVTFNFGPEFKYPPVDIGDRPAPSPVSDVPGPPVELTNADGGVKAPANAYCEPLETPGVKQRMIPDSPNVVESEGQGQQLAVSKKEKVVKRVVKTTPPVLKKRDKPPKSFVSNGSKNGMPPKTPGMASKTPGGPKTPGVTSKMPGVTAPKTPGVASSSKKSKTPSGLPPHPDSKMEAPRHSGKVERLGGGLNLSGHTRSPWQLDKGLEGGQNVAVEVVVESSADRRS